MIVLGVDLSGPSNAADSSLMVFRSVDVHLEFLAMRRGVADEDFYQFLQNYSAQDQLIIGLDAPLSYNSGGGDRPGDQELRQRLVTLGLRSGTVMPPTLTRMVYLTVRGLAVVRLAESITPKPRIVEVHPAGTMAVHGAPIAAIRDFKSCEASRKRLQRWLAERGLIGVESLADLLDHDIAAAAAALAAWKWSLGQSRWLHPAEPPFHPYDFAC